MPRLARLRNLEVAEREGHGDRESRNERFFDITTQVSSQSRMRKVPMGS